MQIGERDLDSDAFAAAIARAAWAAEHVNHTLSGDDHVTQFELLTAAALWAMAEREVQVAVVEAGLGGRYDATSVIDSRVTVLTNVGLEHTRWLGPTVTDIAEEKLAVLRPGTTLVLGGELAPEALAVAERVAGEQDARIVPAGGRSMARRSMARRRWLAGRWLAGRPSSARRRAPCGPRVSADIQLAARGPFQRRNFALARTAAETYLRELGIEPREDAVRARRPRRSCKGACRSSAEDPLTVLDGAHNPDATRALSRRCPKYWMPAHPVRWRSCSACSRTRTPRACSRALLGRCERAWFTAPPSSRALSPAALQSLARQLGFDAVVCEPEPARALAEAQRWARERGAGAAVLATGSVYLVGDLLEHLRSAADGDLGGRQPPASSDRHTGDRAGR